MASKGFIYNGNPDQIRIINDWMDDVDQKLGGNATQVANVTSRVDTVTDEVTDIQDADEFKVWYVFEDTTERDIFFENNPHLLIEDVLIALKDTTPPPTPGVRKLDFSKAYNNQYVLLGFP